MKDKWIKVSDRMPERHLTPALVFLKDGRYCIAWWFITDRGGRWVDWFDAMDDDECYSFVNFFFPSISQNIGWLHPFLIFVTCDQD